MKSARYSHRAQTDLELLSPPFYEERFRTNDLFDPMMRRPPLSPMSRARRSRRNRTFLLTMMLLNQIEEGGGELLGTPVGSDFATKESGIDSRRSFLQTRVEA